MSKGSFLKEELRKFREQQRSAQARVASAKAPAKAKVKVKTELVAVGPVEEKKPHWTDLVAQAQAAPEKRHVPQAIGLKLKRLLDCLLNEERPLTYTELQEKTSINPVDDPELLEALKSNVKTDFDEFAGTIAYQSLYQLKNETQLLALLDKHPEGMLLSDLKDSYKELIIDVKKLAGIDRVIYLVNTDNKEELVYPVDPKFVVNTDADIVQLWRDVPVPENDDSLMQELHKVGLKACVRQAGPNSKRPTAKEEKKDKVRKLRNVQNAHVAEIFKDDMVQQPANKKRKA